MDDVGCIQPEATTKAIPTTTIIHTPLSSPGPLTCIGNTNETDTQPLPITVATPPLPVVGAEPIPPILPPLSPPPPLAAPPLQPAVVDAPHIRWPLAPALVPAFHFSSDMTYPVSQVTKKRVVTKRVYRSKSSRRTARGSYDPIIIKNRYNNIKLCYKPWKSVSYDYADDYDESSSSDEDSHAVVTTHIKVVKQYAISKPAPSQVEESKKRDVICVMCLDRERTHLFTPCMHFCVCQPCAESIHLTLAYCPICRTPTRDIQRVFM